MKPILKLSLVVLILGSFSVQSMSKEAILPTPRGSQVVLDWPQFIKLWEEANKQPDKPKPEAPPVDFILSRAEYTGKFRPKATEISANIEFNILNEEKWVKIPFLPQSLGLKQARLDGKPVTVTHENGFHTLVLKGARHYNLDVIFTIPTPDKDGDPRINFPITETSMTLLNLTFPKPNLDITVQPAQYFSSKSENGETYVQAILPPARNVQLFWTKKLPPNKVLPTKLYSTLYELLTVQDSSIKIQSQFTYSVLHSGTDEIQIRVPENITIINVWSSNLQNWNRGTGDESESLTLFFNKKIKGSHVVRITGEISLDQAVELKSPIIRTVGVEREEGALAIEAKSNVEVSLEKVTGIRQVDVKEVPQDLWNRATTPLLYAFQFTEPKGFLSLDIERHEDVPVLTSTIDSANAVTVLTKDGQWITRASFQVRNHLKQFIALDLPEDAVVWSAFVSGQPVKPSKNKNGQILLPLNKSTLNSGQAAFDVQIVYHQRDHELNVVGNRAAHLPKVDLPISQMLWSVYVPEEFQFLHFGGNMEKERWARGVLPALYSSSEGRISGQKVAWKMKKRADKEALKSEMAESIRKGMRARDAAPAVSRFNDEVVNRQAALEMDAVGGAGSLENHVLPISFQIPEVGRLYRFGKIMVTGTTPHISMTFTHSSVLSGMKMGLWGLFFFLLFRKRKEIMSYSANITKKISTKLKKIITQIPKRKKSLEASTQA